MSRWTKIVGCQGALACIAAMLVLLWPSEAEAGQFRTCFRWDIQTTDSLAYIDSGTPGNTSDDYWEDKYPDGNFASATAGAMGARVRFRSLSSGITYYYWLEPGSGCVSWNRPNGTYTATIYGESKDANGNRVRIHDDPGTTPAPPADPGSFYSWVVSGYNPGDGMVDTLIVGNDSVEATAIAMAAYSLKWYHDGLSNKTIQVGLNSSLCGGNSAHNGTLNNFITQGVHHLTIGAWPGSAWNCPDGALAPGGRRKFTVAHEMGHAIAALYYADTYSQNGDEPGVSNAYSGPGSGSPCTSAPGEYSIGSGEWNSISFREGIAHFISARIFNNRAKDGAFGWFGTAYECERFQVPNSSGGLLENICCPGCSSAALANAGTIGDWFRYFWDLHTNSPSCCGSSKHLTKLEILELYSLTRQWVYLNGSSSAADYYNAMLSTTVSLESFGAPACIVNLFNPGNCPSARMLSNANYNGINN